jgi:Ca2+-binding EF-hand superfamily protein
MTNPKIHFSELISILNEFILDEHEKFLSKFLALFRQIDLDHDGIISNS